jgi:long-chain acyl-CoA synthetase
MQIDLELYRQEVRVSVRPLVRLSVIDIAPDHPDRTLVFLHGFGGRAAQWTHQLHHFSDRNRVIAIDQRGHGRSDKPESNYHMKTLLNDLTSVLDALGVNQPITLVGHSFGGAVAAEFASAHPERVERLALVATAGEFKLNRMYSSLLRLPATVLRSLAPFTRGWLGAPPGVLKAFYDENLYGWVGWGLFSDLHLPTLVVRGHLDRVFERPSFEKVAQAIAGCDEIDVGASGHMVMLERREAVNRALGRFLEDNQRTWRAEQAEAAASNQHGLSKTRPWLPHYDAGVPRTIAIPHVPLHHLLDSAVRRFPLNAALEFEGRRISYLRLGKEANRFAHALRSLGLEKGERVMLVLPNIPQMVVAFYGVLKAGGVAVFTLPTTEPQELVRQIKDSGARALVTLTLFDSLIEQVQQLLDPASDSALQSIIFAHPADELPPLKRLALLSARREQQKHLLDVPVDSRMHMFKRLLASHSPNDAAPPNLSVAPNDLAAIIYTGGTTDTPKGVMLSHRNLVANALQTRHWIPEAQEGRERFLCVLPLAHSYGLTTTLNVPIALAATLILKARFDVQDVLRTIQRQKPTIFPGVPQMYVAIKDTPGVRKYGISSLKACISGSAPLPVEVQEAFEKLTRGRLVEGYGLTEASPVTHANPLRGERKVGSIGVPFPSTEAKIVDLRRSKQSVPTGQIGELAVRGPQVMLGYWNRPLETQQALTGDGWLLTGDVAQMDNDGYFRIIARKADMWYPEKPGDPAFPRDVEEVLFEVPQVKEAAVVAIAGQPIAFVIGKKERPTSEALIAYCKRRLPPALVPRLVIFVDDFPRTFIGKVLRRELARHYEETQRSRQEQP